METVAKISKAKIRLHEDTIKYLKTFGENAERIEGICFTEDTDAEFRKLSRRVVKHYTQGRLNESAFQYLLSNLMETYLTCKTEKLVHHNLSKIF